MKLTIIGAGLSGLMLAVKRANDDDVTVFDKARGVGGRMATRRTDHSKFDHGAQFYRKREALDDLHSRWLERGLSQLWFTENGIEHYCSAEGMTAFAKDLARDVKVELNERLLTVSKIDESWVSEFESGKRVISDSLVITAPLPQAIDILKASRIEPSNELLNVSYTKAIVFLFENVAENFSFSRHGYVEPSSSSIFSIADQRAKGLSKTRSLTVTMKPDFSEQLYEASDDVLIARVRDELTTVASGFESTSVQVKKWRYCQVRNHLSLGFWEIAPRLFLAGDSFGGASLNGAARSATALIDRLNV